MSKKRAGLPSMSDACHDEATAAFAQARTSKHRARMLRAVAAARRAGALLDDERGPGLRREAVLSEREAVNHEGMARVYEAEAHRAESQASAEESIAERKSVEQRRTPWHDTAESASQRQSAKRRSKASSSASGKRATSTSGTTNGRH